MARAHTLTQAHAHVCTQTQRILVSHILRWSLFDLVSLGKAAIIELQTTSYDKDSGEALCMNRLVSLLLVKFIKLIEYE